ncbi:hypothetical protein [Actinomadura rubrisoli]|uniref:Uncharacterized protein n=1 Tax=Actinomadura rubrisoli TaxID=2530368 RepID=A0A4R5CCZ6_9ACTN|nr:hypothetical protein [Actinomadura rubrisoli]TDD96716.1 hypothetical protein E1298_02810 [Actinomadura rubrisoli]
MVPTERGGARVYDRVDASFDIGGGTACHDERVPTDLLAMAASGPSEFDVDDPVGLIDQVRADPLSGSWKSR